MQAQLLFEKKIGQAFTKKSLMDNETFSQVYILYAQISATTSFHISISVSVLIYDE